MDYLIFFLYFPRSHCSNTCFFPGASLCYLKLQCCCSLPKSPLEHRSFFSRVGWWQGESDFPLDWTQPVPSFKSHSLDFKEKHRQRREAKSTLTFHRGNSPFVHRDSDLFQCSILRHSLSFNQGGEHISSTNQMLLYFWLRLNNLHKCLLACKGMINLSSTNNLNKSKVS